MVKVQYGDYVGVKIKWKLGFVDVEIFNIEKGGVGDKCEYGGKNQVVGENEFYCLVLM